MHLEDIHKEKIGRTVQEQVLETIRRGELAMRPKWHFVLRGILMALGGIILSLLLLYLASFILFAINKSGVIFVPAFGGNGWYSFFWSLPWLLIFLTVLFIAILEILVRKYSFGYRQPLLYSALGIIGIGTFAAYGIAATPFHQSLFDFAEKYEVPFARDFYRGYGAPEIHDVHLGRIASTTENGFTIIGRRGTLEVVITPNTRFPYGLDFVEGDMVVVFGEIDDRIITAVGIRTAPDDLPMGPPRGERHRIPIGTPAIR